jgi:radical SAM protein with 4Fe4S-binding SPASM domain
VRQGIELTREPSEIDEIAGRALDIALANDIYLETNIESVARDARNLPHVQSPFDILHENAHIVELYQPGACISTSITVFVEWDGTVLPCFQHRIPLGNIREQRFSELWNGSVMQRHRETFLTRDLDPFCARCQHFFCDHA